MSDIGDKINSEYPKLMEEMKDALCRVEQASKKSRGLPTEPEDDVTNIKNHLEDTLKWLADDVVHFNKVISPKDRKARLEVISSFVQYVRDYETNMEIIQSHKQKTSEER